MAVKPLSDRVLVKPNPAEEKTAGGLFIPDTAKEKPLAGKVVAVGTNEELMENCPSYKAMAELQKLEEEK